MEMPTLEGGDYVLVDVQGIQVKISPEDEDRVNEVSWTVSRAGRILSR